MAKVFISYQSDDRPVVTLLAGALSESGHSVWWDRGLGGDEEWRTQIEEQLSGCDVVLTVWTGRSLDSRWVYSEADEGDKNKKLAQVTLDGTLPPKPFDRLQCIDLLTWNGDTNDVRLEAVREAILRISTRRGGGVVAERPLPDNTAAEGAWMLIHSSLEPREYREFLARHSNAPQARFAQKHLEQLEAFEKLDKSDATAISEFVHSGPFKVLGELAQKARADALMEDKNRTAKRLMKVLPFEIEGYLRKECTVANGRLFAHYEAGDRSGERHATAYVAALSRSPGEAARVQRDFDRGAFSIIMSELDREWEEWVMERIKRDEANRSVGEGHTFRRATIDGRPLLEETHGSNFVQLFVALDGKYAFHIWGFMPREDLRDRLQLFDLTRIVEICDGVSASSAILRSQTRVRSRETDNGGLTARADAEPQGHISTRRTQVRSSRSGGVFVRGLVLVALLGSVIAGGWYYLEGQARLDGAPAFEVQSHQSLQVMVTRDDGSNYRVAPFARDNVDVLAESVTGEALAITGIVRQPDGDWYQVRLRNGRTAYLKASLAVPESLLIRHDGSASPAPCAENVTDNCIQRDDARTQPSD